MPVDQWAAKYRHISIGNAPGLWRNETTPYLVEIMRAFTDPTVRRMTIMKGSQTGGTEAVYNCIFRTVDVDPTLMMFVYPDAGSTADQNQVRFIPTVKATPKMLAHLTPRAHDLKDARVRFDSCDLLFRGAMSEHQLESFPLKYVFVDELDRCPPRTAHLAYQRIKTYPGGKLVCVSKPSIAGVGIDAEYEASDQRVYKVPCPHCGIYHERTDNRFRWYGRQDDGTMGLDSRDLTVKPETALKTAWLKCPNSACKGRCGAEHNHWQLLLGVWCRKGDSVTPLLRRPSDGTVYISPTEQWLPEPGKLTSNEPQSSHRGWLISEYISGLIPNPYGEGAAAFVANKGMLTQDLVCDHRGRGWKAAGTSVEVKALRERIDQQALNGQAYRLGEVPEGVMVLVAVADVQVGSCYVTVIGFGAGGRERWTIWYEEVPCPADQGLFALDEVFYKRKWIRRDGTPMAIYVRGVDTGDRTVEVYDYCRQRPKCYGVRGADSAQMDQLYVWKRFEKYPDGQTIPNGVQVLRISSTVWKMRMLNRLGIGVRSQSDAPDATDELEAEDAMELGPAVWHLPKDANTDYLEQLTAEQFVSRVTRGKKTTEWVMRPGRRGNHYFDASYYIEALADSFNVRKLQRVVGLPRPDSSGQAAPPTAPTKREGTGRYGDGNELLRAARQEGSLRRAT